MLSPLDTLMLPSVSVVVVSELKRRMKAEKKASEKEAKVKDQVEQQETNDQADEETLDPNVSYMDVYDRPSLPLVICFRTFDC